MTRNSRLLTYTLILALSTVLMAGCFNRDRQPIYADSEEIPPLQVPSDLDEPRPRTAYNVPGYSLPELAARGNEDRPPRVLPSAEAERSRSHIRFGPTGLYLEVQDEADSVWRRLGFSLDRAGMSLRETDESARRYHFRLDHEPVEADRSFWQRVAFWRGTEVIDYSGVYVAKIEVEEDELTRVALFDRNGEILDMDTGEYVLSILRERLG